MKAATLEIDVVVGELARLQRDLSTVKRSVKETMGEAAAGNRQAEREATRLAETMERQAATYGRNASQLRRMDAEMKAFTANQAGFNGLAQRIMDAAAAVDRAEAAEAKLSAEARAAALAQAELAKAAASVKRERDQGIASATGYLAVLEREAATAGMTATQLKQLEVAERAAAAEALGLSEVAAKIRAAGAAMEQSTTKAAVMAAAEKRLADEHARLAAQVRASHDAQEADAAAAERLRAATDPLYAATKRLNDEIAESTRLYHAGATAPAEYARQQEVLAGRLRQVGQAHDTQMRAIKGGAGTMTQLSFQLNDIATMASLGAKPMQIFASQAGQIFQIAQMAEGGIAGFAKQVSLLALAWAPVIAAFSVVAVGFSRWQDQVNDDSGIKKYVDGLGLTHKELKKLGDVSVSTGDMIAGMWKTISDGLSLGGSGKRIMDYLYSPDDMRQLETFISQIYGLFAGGYAAIVELWAQIGPAVAAFFKPLVDAATWAAEGVMKAFRYVYDTVAGWLQTLKGWVAPLAKAWGADFDSSVGGKVGASIGAAFGKGYSQGAKQFVTGVDSFFAKSGANAVAAAEKRYKAQADKIKADRTPTTDKHAESLAREAQAIEAQIVNLHKLADAYGVSGAAALIAEAREKAESKAIKQRGDIEAAVDRQIRLSIAQRLADAAKSTASLKDQAIAQERVNAQVEAGAIPAEKAADALRDQLALLPLLAAQEAARQRGLVADVALATKAIDDQTAAQQRFDAARAYAQFQDATASGDDQLEILREELRLIGATDAARVHALATLKATQEAEKFNPGDRAAYIAQQVKIADQTEANRQAQERYNASLTFTADLWDELARNVSTAARGIADAFGSVGKAIGGMAEIYSDFAATQQRQQTEHKAAIEKAGKNEADIQRENALYAARTATAQIGLFGDMADAAQDFFDKGSAGYKALHTAEQIFRAAEFAMSVKSMVQNTAETATKIANSAKSAIAKGTEAVVNAMRDMPFPLNIAAAAATAATVAALGIGIAGGFGGKNTLPKANDGAGSVLGDSDAKSDSLKRAIDLVSDLQSQTLVYTTQMAASLKSIEGQIGGLASLVVRSGDVQAELGIPTGFKSSLTDRAGGTAMLAGAGAGIGMIASGPLGAIIGTALGSVIGTVFKGLFGTKTSVVGSGIYGGAQSVGDIMANGFDGATYADVQKKKKVLGLTASTKYSTQYGDMDAALEQQFGLILKSFADSIKASADPLGLATDEVTKRLNSFVVSIGKVDLKGLSGTEVQERLEAVFGKAADQMAAAAIPGLEKWQAVGEGAFETLVRVASTVETVTSSLDMLGRGAKGIGIDASMALASLFDSVSDLQAATATYFETYYTEAEQAAVKTKQLSSVFGSLGLAMPDSIAGFRALVDAQDLTTAAGRETYAALLKLSPAFAEIVSGSQEASSAAAILRERNDLERQLLDLQGDTAAIRALELAQLNPSNRALMERINALKDAQAAEAAAARVAEEAAQRAEQLASQRAALERQLLQINGNTAAIRALDLAEMDESLRALQQLVWARQDEIDAAAKAAQAAEELAQKQAAVAQERSGLEQQILQLMGDTTELRRREREALDPSNRALYDQIQAIKDQQAAAAAAQQAAEEAARAADQLRDAWKSIGDGLLEEVKRIRGLSDTVGAQTYASVLSQFNAATIATRGGDQEAGKSLAGLSKSLIDAAAGAATSQQELDRIRMVTANSLEDTYRLIMKASGNSAAATAAIAAMSPAVANDNAPAWQTATLATPTAVDATATEIRAMRRETQEAQAELLNMTEQMVVLTSRIADIWERAALQGGGDGIAVVTSTERDDTTGQARAA
ncbi:hypothetical protein [uncultured Sphingomonas sp.]|uniref:hypothetical protein n=1 Tax=uncultured Sphingomonas sp. TaxID=158754 RepID=UPI0025DA91E8|nr:hypothetical protein [uncultured Sphingomonas sp.]